MQFGEYLVVVEQSDGKILSEWVRTATASRPHVGDEVVLSGRRYVVHRVVYEDDPSGRGDRDYAFPRVIVRPFEAAPQKPTTKPPKSGKDRVLSLTLPGGPLGPGVTSVEWFPVSLAAIIVWCGYRVQVTYYKACLRQSLRLRREGADWFVEEFDLDQVRELRTRAKSALDQMRVLLVELSEGGVPQEVIEDGPYATAPSASLPESASELPASPPPGASVPRVLRLVCSAGAP